MKFKMFENDGTPVEYNGVNFWTATNDAYINEHGIITVDTK